MRFGVKSHYALLAMIDVAQNSSAAPVRLQEVAERQKLPVPYLEQLFSLLKHKGIINSTRGQKGGYRLAMDPTTVFVTHILEAVEEPLQVTRCSSDSHSGCQGGQARCQVHALWEELEDQIETFLAQKTLADLCKQQTAHLKVARGLPGL